MNELSNVWLCRLNTNSTYSAWSRRSVWRFMIVSNSSTTSAKWLDELKKFFFYIHSIIAFFGFHSCVSLLEFHRFFVSSKINFIYFCSQHFFSLLYLVCRTTNASVSYVVWMTCTHSSLFASICRFGFFIFFYRLSTSWANCKCYVILPDVDWVFFLRFA